MTTKTATALMDHARTSRAENPTAALERVASRRTEKPMLLREALGLALRAFRADKNVTLRDLAEQARVSPGYLSEVERGRKEVSSELLASVCHALDARVADVIIEAAAIMTMPSVNDELANTTPAAAE